MITWHKVELIRDDGKVVYESESMEKHTYEINYSIVEPLNPNAQQKSESVKHE